MKARFRTPWKREATPGYTPTPINAYKAAVMVATLQAILRKETIQIHTLDQSYDIVVDVSDVPHGMHTRLQDLIMTLAESNDLCVFVPVDGIVVPVAYQERMLPYLDAGNDVMWHPLPLTNQPALFVDLHSSLDFTADADAIHNGVVSVLTRSYLHDQGGAEATPVAITLRSEQNIKEAIDVLRTYLWTHPDTVDGVFLPERQSVEWVWAGTIDPYTGPARVRAPTSRVVLADVPNGYTPLGTGTIGDDVQRALGEPLRLLKWRDVVLVPKEQASECALLAKSLNTMKYTSPTPTR